MNSFLMPYFFVVKCLLIVLVLQRAPTRDFNIFDVDKVFLFTSQTILLLNCGDNLSGFILIWTFQVISDNGFTAS